MDTFETERLLMRPLLAEDREFYCTCYTDPILMRHIGLPLSREAASRSLTSTLKAISILPARRYEWIMQEKESKAYIGLLGLVCDATNVELGHIMLTQYQNRGYTLEAINALMDVVFRTTKFTAFLVNHRSRNSAVIRVVKKLGFSPQVGNGGDVRGCWNRLRTAN